MRAAGLGIGISPSGPPRAGLGWFGQRWFATLGFTSA